MKNEKRKEHEQQSKLKGSDKKKQHPTTSS